MKHYFHSCYRPAVRLARLLAATLVLVSLFSSVVPFVAHAASTVITVNTASDTIANDGKCSLREAIIAANTNAASGNAAGECTAGSATAIDTISVPAGTYTVNLGGAANVPEDAALKGDLDILGSVIIQGASPSTSIIQAGTSATNGIDRVFDINPSGALTPFDVQIQNMTIKNGNVNGKGGGIMVMRASLELTNATLTSNTAGPPKGVGADGGAIAATGATVMITNATINGNTAKEHGGGLFLSNRFGGSYTLANVTITGNTAVGQGGGLLADYDPANDAPATTTITNVTFAGNTAATGGNIYTNNAAVQLGNTLLVQTSGTNCASASGSPLSSPGGNISSDASCSAALTSGGDRNSTAIALGTLAINAPGTTATLALPDASPAIDAGDAYVCAAAAVGGVDQRGVARTQGLRCDVGAYEYNDTAPMLTLLSMASMAAGEADRTLTVVGGNFQSGATAKWGSTSLATTFVNANTLSAVLPAGLIATATTASITVVNPDAKVSNPKTFSVIAGPSLVTGVVSDATPGGHSWPLYASVRITGPNGYDHTLFTDPVTGQYRVSLQTGVSYAFSVNAVASGYATATRVVTPQSGTDTQAFGLSIDIAACSAPGYAGAPALDEHFDAGTLPSGWIDLPATGQNWRFDNPGGPAHDPGERGNLTGGSGNFAILDSDFYGDQNSQDAELRTPSLNVTGQTSVQLSFGTDFKYAPVGSTPEVADVDVSTDGGSTWANVWRHSGASYRGARREVIDISTQAANQANVIVRFHYYHASFDYWWQVDNVKVAACGAQPVGVLVGTVFDATSGAVVNGATVGNGNVSATSAAMPLDPTHPGFYTLVLPTGTYSLTAALASYPSDVRSVTVQANTCMRQDFIFPAVPIVSTDPATSVSAVGTTLNATVTPNGLASVEFLWSTTAGGPYTTVSAGTADGLTSHPVSALLTGLATGTTYYYRARATTAAGSAAGAEQSFTTPAVLSVATDPATALSPTGATLNARVAPYESPATVVFRWGTTAGSYPNTLTVPGTLTGNLAQQVSAALTGLTPATTYYFRVEATDSAGTVQGAEQSFTTPAVLSIVTDPATAITAMSATLNGRVTPIGSATTVVFRWGTTASGPYPNTLTVPGTLTGTTSQVVRAAVTGLAPGTTYYFRVEATDSAGTRQGEVQHFTTTLSPTSTTVTIFLPIVIK